MGIHQGEESMSIVSRKSDHIRIVLEEDVDFRGKATGFQEYDFVHCALPELDYSEVSTEVTFLGKSLTFPLMISAMTGGCPDALVINEMLAELIQAEGLAIGVGSQRPMADESRYKESYRIVREKAPDRVIVGNVGAAQIARMEKPDSVKRMVEVIQANAMAVHLNPLQECLQPEGDRDFTGVLRGIEDLVRALEVPVMVKEVGCGISQEVAERLANVGVQYIDVAGAGGTSWAAVESFRQKDTDLAGRFRDWGLPTAISLKEVTGVRGIHAIASGGIRDGQTMAKALALGAEICGAAAPFLRVLSEGGVDALRKTVQEWRESLKMVLFLTGSRSIDQIRRPGVIYFKGRDAAKREVTPGEK
jgi:isopentenyl-diphosphate delta-isomerase